VAEQEVLGGDDGARGEESRDGSDYVAEEVDHRAILGPVVSQIQLRRVRASSETCASSFCGAQAPEPHQTMGNDKLEVVWTLLPILTVVALFGMSLRTMAQSDPPADREPDLAH
jgi:hypothetical protein